MAVTPELEPSAAAEKPNRRTTDSMIPSIYDELRGLAARKLANEPAGQTLSATALVHEAYLALAKSGDPLWDNRGHFYVAAAESMRRILINRARAKNAQRPGGGKKAEPLPEDSINVPAAPSKSEELLALDEALTRLVKNHERKVQLVNLRSLSYGAANKRGPLLNLMSDTLPKPDREISIPNLSFAALRLYFSES